MCETLFSQANTMLKIEQKVKKASNMSEAKLKENIYTVPAYVMSLCFLLKYFIFDKKAFPL